jgi:hypothetical protein
MEKSMNDPHSTDGNMAAALDADARKLRDLGQDPGPTLSQFERNVRVIPDKPANLQLEREIAQSVRTAFSEASALQARDLKRYEAKRDALLGVMLAVRRRGDDPATGWTARDFEVMEQIANLLIELNNKK